MASSHNESKTVEAEEKSSKNEWQEPAYSKLKAEETATGFAAFDEDSDTKTGS